jgi:hypothetical protein
MAKKFVSIALFGALLAGPLAALAVEGDRDDGHSKNLSNRDGIRRVLLISIDGMHAVDYQNCVADGYCPALSALGQTRCSGWA